jgi:hypothetical protein
MKTIYEFKKGDEIVKIQPAKGLFGQEDGSFIGKKMIFVGIANGQIYLQRTDKFELSIFGDELVNLPVDIWVEGWDLFIDPKKEGFESKMNVSIIKEQIKKAIENEDYELAEKLNKLLHNGKVE